MSTDQIVWLIIGLVILGVIIYFIIQNERGKRASERLTKEEFAANMRRAQVIDVRERDEFIAGHILGARNIPYSQMKQRLYELRKDQPIYMYDNGELLSKRAGLLLKKNDFKDLYRLEGGYEEWDGKIKKG